MLGLLRALSAAMYPPRLLCTAGVKQKESETDCSGLVSEIVDTSNQVNAGIKKMILL